MITPIVPQKLTYSVSEAAQALGVSKSTMYELVRTEGFPVLYVGNKKLIPIKALERWTEKCAAEGCKFN